MERIIVFDMDETLGTFIQIHVFISAIVKLIPSLDHTTEFCKLMDLFSIVQRPYIVNILKYACSQRDNGNIDRIVLYTNNRGTPLWVSHIASFFERQTKCKIFDDCIYAYNIDGRIIDNRRTTNDKTVSDLYRCLNIKTKCDICFIDDQYHARMVHPDVTYLQIKPYNYAMSYREMALLYHNRYPLYNKKKFIEDITTIIEYSGHRVHTTSRRQLQGHIATSEYLRECIRKFCNRSNK